MKIDLSEKSVEKPLRAEDKIMLIRLFQRTEGNYDCFATTYSWVCGQDNCLWRQECLNLGPKRQVVA